MPIYMETSPLHRLVTIVARGTVSGEEVRGTAQKLADARVRRFAKIQNAPKVRPAAAGAVVKVAEAAAEAWADPDRQGTVIRGARTREFTTREPVH